MIAEPSTIGEPTSTGKDSRHPDEFLILFLLLAAGLGIVLGGVPEPGTIEEALPRWAAITWGYGLLVGPLITFLGIFWRGKRDLDGVLVEQVGQVIVGSVAAFYATVLLIAAWPASVVVAPLIYAIAGARFWRWWQLQRLIKVAHAHIEGSSTDGV